MIKSNEKKDLIQKEALNILRPLNRAGIVLSMGVGKTRLGLKHMIENLKEDSTFLVVAPKISIFNSWKKEAEEMGEIDLLSRITFSTYRSIEKNNIDYDVIYLDECHNLLPSHVFYLSMFGGKILGLTGTPPRHERSEKAKIIESFCPIVYSYLTDDAVNDSVLNDYEIFVHVLEMNSQKTMKVFKKNSTSFFMTSERASYNFWTERIDTAFSQKQKSIFRIMRMKALMSFKTKEDYAINLLKSLKHKTIVFANTTEQASRLCSYSYHSKNKDSEKNLKAFINDEIDKLSCVLQLSEGVNIPNLKSSIILHSYSNENKTSQRLGRTLRLNPDDKAVIHVLAYNNSVDMEWVKEALKDFNQEKIRYIINP